MVIRRIRDHVAEHNWFAVAVDVGIVVLGVFLGTQVSNWNEERKDRAQGHEDRQRLVADLRANEIDLANRIIYFKGVLDHAKATLEALNKPRSTLGGPFIIDAYQATQIVPREGKHVTYDEIVSTGRLTRLGEPTLRDRVGNYYILQRTTEVTFANITPYREKLRRAVPGDIQVAIRSDCPEDRQVLPDDTILNTLKATCDLKLDPQSVATGVNAVLAIPELGADINRLIGDLAVKSELAGIMRQRAATLAKQILDEDKKG